MNFVAAQSNRSVNYLEMLKTTQKLGMLNETSESRISHPLVCQGNEISRLEWPGLGTQKVEICPILESSANVLPPNWQVVKQSVKTSMCACVRVCVCACVRAIS